MPLIGIYKGKQHLNAEAATRAARRDLNKFGKGLGPAVAQEVKRFLDKVAKTLVDRNSTPWPGGTTSTTIASRTGTSIRSIPGSVRVKGTTLASLEGRIGGKFPLIVHEEGRVIRSANYMTIPLPAALDKRGVPLRKSSRHWNNTFVRRTSKGNLIIFQKRPNNVVIPLYLLKKEVRIPARLGMEKLIREELPLLQNRIFSRIEREFLSR